jgi:tRNA 2-thiouridine synthesizing protein A
MATEVLDVRGKTCPIPLLLTKRKLESMRTGDLLEVLGDFPQTMENIQRLVERTGNQMIKVEESRGEFSILIRKNTSENASGALEENVSCKSSE